MIDFNAISKIGTYLSILCSLLLTIVWCLNPKWRSLHNFISTQQILIGTVHLCLLHLYRHNDFAKFLAPKFFMASICWSLCATLLAYLKLVLIYPGKLCNEKSKAAIFSYTTLLIVDCICDFIVPAIFELNKDPNQILLLSLSSYILINLNLCMFLNVVFVVLSCCKTRIASTGGTRVVPVLGVAIVCDIITMLLLLNFILDEPNLGPIKYTLAFDYRLIPHTFVVLFNKSSMEYLKTILRNRRRRALNRII